MKQLKAWAPYSLSEIFGTLTVRVRLIYTVLSFFQYLKDLDFTESFWKEEENGFTFFIENFNINEYKGNISYTFLYWDGAQKLKK